MLWTKTIGTNAGIIWNLLSNKEKWDIKIKKKPAYQKRISTLQ